MVSQEATMCGIAGFFDGAADLRTDKERFEQVLIQMRNRIRHRGPDAEGIYLGKCAGLAHTRLSIRDIKDGKQPMARWRGSHSYQIVYNGEIYNAGPLRKELEHKGWRFQTTSDTEVILLCFLEYGPEFVDRLEGIFAFAILDEKHETLYLYRDSFGIKPLFYTEQNGVVIFGSEPKAILAYPGVRPEIDRAGLGELLGMGPARIPGSGLYRGFREVKPGYYISINRFGLHSQQYWHLSSHPHEDDYDTTIRKTGEMIRDVIRRQMVSDVPICTFLSGGVDSSVVSAVCAEELRKRGERLTTYSFDFTGNQKYFKANDFQPSQDRPYVDQMVAFLDSVHHYLECDYQTQADLLYDSVDSHDMPCMADVDSSLVHFCRLVSQNHKVVLTGECADEVFGGYPWFHKEQFLSSGTFPWTPDLAPRQTLLRKELLAEIRMEEFVQEIYDQSVREIAVLPGESDVEANRRRIGYLNIRYFMQTLLNRMDRTSMHSGLEARVPFADRELVDYIFNVPWEMKAKDGIVKNVLRQASRGLLPDEILFRRKSPYPKSYDPYYEQLLGKRLMQVLEDSNAPILQIVDKEKVQKFIDSVKDYGKPWYGQLMAGPQMLAYLLQINYWLDKYGVMLRL